MQYAIKFKSNLPIKTGFHDDACFPMKTTESRSVGDSQVEFPSIRGKIVVRIKKLLVFNPNLNIQIFILKILSEEVCQAPLCQILLFLQTVVMVTTHGCSVPPQCLPRMFSNEYDTAVL